MPDADAATGLGLLPYAFPDGARPVPDTGEAGIEAGGSIVTPLHRPQRARTAH